jgi:predicted TIM-barrel fold metal-dependent hydrolase
VAAGRSAHPLSLRRLRRDSPPLPAADYRADAAPIRIDQTVYVETEWDPTDPVGEMRYVESLRRAFGLPTVAVAQAWLDHADAPDILAQQAAFAFVRSVRHKPRANRSPAEIGTGRHGGREVARGLCGARP